MNLNDEYERAAKMLSGKNRDALDDAFSMFKVMVSKERNKMYPVHLKGIFNRLTTGLPLTELTSDDFDEVEVNDGVQTCKTSRYKYITATRVGGATDFSYTDSRRVDFNDQRLLSQDEQITMIDILHTRANAPSIAVQIVDALFPITLPYMPGEKYTVFGSTHVFKMSSGEPDLVEIDFIETPKGQLIKVDRYFRKISDGNYRETDLENYNHYRQFGAVDLNYKWVKSLIDIDPKDSEIRHFRYFVAKDIEEKNGELVGTVIGRLSFVEPNVPFSCNGHMLESFEIFPPECFEKRTLYIRDIDTVVSNDEVLKMLKSGGVVKKWEIANVKDVVIAMISSLNEYCERQLKQ